jgi:hypothetical protein
LKKYFRCDRTLKWEARMAVEEKKQKSKGAKVKRFAIEEATLQI